MALITASATLQPSGLAHDALWWTERRWWYRDGRQDRGKHGARFLSEKSLCRRGPVCPCEEKVVHRRQTGPLSGMVKSAQLMVPQGEISVASFHIGTGALEDLREPFGLVLEVVLLHEASPAQRSAGLKEWGA